MRTFALLKPIPAILLALPCLSADSTHRDFSPVPFVAKWRGNCAAAVSFTFDDGIRDQYELAFPKMTELGIRGTFFLNGGPIENQKPTRQGALRMTWEMVKEMSDAGMEMSNHGFNHANHGRSSRETVEVDIASNDVLIARHTGKKPITYAYPNNAKNREWSAEVVNPGRVGSRTRQQSFGGKSGPYGRKFFKKAKQEGGWLVLMTHAIAKGYDQWRDPEVFYALLAEAAHDKDLWVATFAEVSIYERLRSETKVAVTRTEKGWHVSVTPPKLDKTLFAGTLDLVLPDGTIRSFDPFGGDFDIDFISGDASGTATIGRDGLRPVRGRDGARPSRAVSFEVGENEFLLNGQPFVLRCGEMHYARVPRAYWQHRLKMLRAMGCNAVGCYMFWNFHEREQGVFTWEGRADAAAFCRFAQEEGLWVILRPGPYSCAEWEGGGAPWWLMEEGRSKKEEGRSEREEERMTRDGIRMRSSDPRWLEPAKRWIAEVGRQLAPLQVTKGGPILMVQVENEYGLHGNDANYIRALRDATLAAGFDVPLYACNPPRVMQNGFIPELFQAANFGAEPEARFAVLRQYQKKGPLMCAEFYPAWFDTWGQSHHPPKSDREFFGPIDWMLDHRASFSLYMAHGGTSFGGWAGCRNPFVPNTTSYDYEAPISEQGRANPSYAKFRERAAQHLNPGETIPDPPAPIPVKSYGAIEMRPSGGVEQLVTRTVALDEPVYMEQLGQGFGLVSYEREIGADDAGALSVDEVHDFGYVFLDGAYLGTLDRRHRGLKVTIPSAVGRAGSMSPPDSSTPRRRLVILLEAMGRINSSQGMEDRKGLSGRVRLGGKTLAGGWQAKLMPIDPDGDGKVGGESRWQPSFHRGSLTVSGAPADTYLDMRGWKKGIVWVNGHNLGRYWEIGPQQTLYLPGCWLKEGANEVVILDFFGQRSSTSQTSHATQTIHARDTPILGELHPELDFNRHERSKDVPKADQVVATGEFKNTDEAQVVMFEKPVTSDVFKFSITKTYDKKNLASVGEFDLLDEKGNPLTALGLAVAGVSSEEEVRADGVAENAIDGQVEACWMTSSRNLPHWVVFKATAPATIGGFRYTPNPRNVGRVAGWSFSIEEDPLALANLPRPLLAGFHPDPSVCHGKDRAYYLVTSTFLWNPGLPIYRSSDFRQWSLVGHALPDVKTLPIDGGATEDDGVWAPTIRYHEGTYYLVFTWSSGKRKINYLSTARDPAGPWSAPRAVACPDNAGIDPSLFLDDDGKVYWQANRMIPDKEKEWRGQTMCYVQEIDLKEAKLVGERHDVSSGLARGSSHCEGPHIYKFGEKCYILAHAEGGTGRDHAETVKVSENVFGPYRPIRTNPVLTRRDRKDVPGLQCAGHVDFVRSGKNDYLAVFLGQRAYGADCRRLLGRETFACPVLWRDGDLIVKDQELVAGEFATPEPECTIALPGANVRLRRVREIAFDETVSLAPGESAVLYRSQKLNIAWPWEEVESKVKVKGEGEVRIRIRLVSKDGLTVQAFVGETPIGAPRDLSVLCQGGKGANFTGLGVGVRSPVQSGSTGTAVLR